MHATPSHRPNPARRLFRPGLIAALTLTTGLGLAREAVAQCETVADTIRPSGGERYSAGRIALSADGSTLIVGDSFTQSAYFFARQNNAWVREATFTGPALFGRGSAVSSDGNLAAVSSESQVNSAAVVNIYTRSAGVWTLVQSITYNGPGGGFGLGLCMSADGGLLFVGQSAGSSDRCVHVYTRANGAYTHTAQLIPSDPNNARFGQQLGCSFDGSVVAGSAADRTFVFVRSGQTWTERQVLSTPGASAPSFNAATAVSRDGTRIFVGKPDLQVVYCFAASGPTYNLTQTIEAPGPSSNFGAYVMPDPTGSTLLVGSPTAWTSTGAVYVYGETAGWWDRLAPRIDAPIGLSTGPGFGFQVATNGTTLVVGAQNDNNRAGALCTFTLPASTLFGVIEQPDAATAQPGGQAAFSVGVTPGTPVTYRWRRNGASLTDGAGVNGTTVSGSSTATLTIANLTHADHGAVFDCIVRSSCAAVASNAASLSVGADCPIDFNNDGFVDFFDYDDFVAAFEAGC